jgi:hypothetical protein
MPELINPYIAGNPVTSPEMFFGRGDVFAFVRQALIGKHRDNVIILFGQRRAGKTSVLYQMNRQLGARYVCVLLDLHGLALEGLDGFLWELANSIARALRRDYRIELTPPPRAAFQSSPRSQFENVFLNQVWSALGDRHLLLMLDEAIRLQEQVQAGKLEPEVFEYLRYLMQHFPRLNFLFALGDGLEGMTKEYAFLFSVGLYKKISFLERDAALKLITQPVQNSYAVEPDAQERVLQITGGHPYYTQLLCHGLFQRWLRTRAPVIQVADVDAVVDEAVERGLAVLKHTWEESYPAEKAILSGAAAAMRQPNAGNGAGTIVSNGARGATSAEDIARTLKGQDIQLPADEAGQAFKSLLARDILAGTDPYRFTVDLQRLWINKYERVEWVRDELAESLRKWTALARAAAPPPPRFSMPEYPTLKTPPARRSASPLVWLGGIAIVALLVILGAFFAAPQFFGLQPAVVVAPTPPTQVAVEPTQTATRPPPTPTRALPTPIAETVRGAATAEAEPTPEFGSGVKIVFTSGTPGCSTLGIMNLDDGKTSNFNPSPNNEEPTWSPDGRLFVASTGDCQNTQYGLTLFDAETGDTIPVPLECATAIDPSWGEDDRIYFACGARTGNGDLYSVNPDGSDLRALGISARRPTLSPDGKFIAYMRQEEDVWRIWVAELNAGGAAVNPTQMPFPQVLGGVFARQPRWNSDGTRLFFNVTDQTSLAAIALASVELATGSTNVSFITPDTNTPFVRPVCGKGNVCVASGANGGLWLLEDVGGALIPRRQLTFGEEYGADVYP